MADRYASIDPIKSCCMKRASEHKGVMCPDGLTMCCLCFERFPRDELYVDKNGNTFNVCNECIVKEALEMFEKKWLEDPEVQQAEMHKNDFPKEGPYGHRQN